MILRSLSETRGVITLMFDEGPSLRVRRKHFAKLPLNEGDPVDFEEYENALSRIQFDDATEAALTLLDHSAQSVMGLRQKLMQKGYVPFCVEQVIARLQEYRLLDDAALAQRFTQSRLHAQDGIYAVRRKLRARGVDEETARQAVEDLMDDAQQLEAALAALRKLYPRYADRPSREARARLSQALARRGFSWDVISQALDRFLSDEPD